MLVNCYCFRHGICVVGVLYIYFVLKISDNTKECFSLITLNSPLQSTQLKIPYDIT